MGRHDLSYRDFFSHLRMIRDLLREIVGEQWVERIDGSWLQEVIMPRLGLSEAVSAKRTLEDVETMLAESIDRWAREIREESREEGLQEGLQKGRQKGRQEEGARLVLRQLRLKFGALEPEIESRVRSADADRLLEWGERIVTAESLQDIFKD